MTDDAVTVTLHPPDAADPVLRWERGGQRIFPVHWIQSKLRNLPIGPRAELEPEVYLRAGDNVCLIGEHGSGYRELVDWLTHSPALWDVVVIEDKDGRIGLSGHAAWGEETRESLELRARELFAVKAEPGARAHAWSQLIEILEGNAKSPVVCMQFLNSRSPYRPLPHHLEITTMLRSWRDTPPQHPTRLVLSATNEGVFYSVDNVSDFIVLANTGRLPIPVPAVAIHQVLQERLNRWKDEITGDDARAVYEVTGGHRELLLALCEIILSSDHGTLAMAARIQRAARSLAQQHPGSVAAWRRGLIQMLEDRPALIAKLSQYVRGQTSSENVMVSIEDRSLFLGGWVARNQYGRWGIRSCFHELLAREVIFSLQSQRHG